MRRIFIIVIIIFGFLMSACGNGVLPVQKIQPTITDTQQSTKPSEQAYEQSQKPPYEFYDLAVKECVEKYFDKSADEFTKEDFDTLAKLISFNFDSYGKQITTLCDLPKLFPNIKYIEISYFMQGARLSEADCRILEEMKSLCAVNLNLEELPSLDFTKKLPYVSLRYTEEVYQSDKNNLADVSVLGRNFIETYVSGQLTEYVKVVDGERVYELIVTDNEIIGTDVLMDQCYETKVFISEMRNNEYHFLDVINMTNRIVNASGGLILADANFDGQKDILVLQGHFGAQYAAVYDCFLSDDGTYKLNESFSKISNPALDYQNKQVLSTWRNWAASHSWAMLSYIDGEFVKTDSLTQEPEETGDDYNETDWMHLVERFDGKNVESQTYLKRDYSGEEWSAIFYDENSFWGLRSNKWRTLFNQGSIIDWSLYGSGVDAQIMEIIEGW